MNYNKRRLYICATLLFLAICSIYAFVTLDYDNIDFCSAVSKTFYNFKTMFTEAKASHFTFSSLSKALLMTMSLAFITTLLGACGGLLVSFFAASNISSIKISNFIKGCVAVIRAIPTILWVLIFSISVGLGSEAAVLGMSFHTFGYLIKAYSETFEKVDAGTIDALKSCGANRYQIVRNALLPSTFKEIFSWTFLRLEINFANAIAMGAAAGAGGIGFELFMSTNYYFNVREAGLITITILLIVVFLEQSSNLLKKRL